MNWHIARLIGMVCLILLPACSPNNRTPQTDPRAGQSDASSFDQSPQQKPGAKRDGIQATPLLTTFQYGEGLTSALGIASGSKAFRSENNEAVGTPVLVASDAELVDEAVDGAEVRLIRVNMSLRNSNDKEVAKLVAFFRPFGDTAFVVKTILDEKYESTYKWGDLPGYSLATVTTTDRTSGSVVLKTDKVEVIPDSGGLFRGLEHHLSNGEVMCVTEFIRHAGTGLLVAEKVHVGSLPRDYHPYEFVLSGWPAGRSPRSGGF